MDISLDYSGRSVNVERQMHYTKTTIAGKKQWHMEGKEQWHMEGGKNNGTWKEKNNGP
jgi:hypothetical protein